METLPPLKAYQGGYAYTSCRLGFALLLFGALGWVAEAWPGLAAAWAPLGRRSLFVYVGHLAVIFGTPWTVGLALGRYHALTLGTGCLFVLLVGGLTFGGLLLWDWIRNFSSRLGTLVYTSALIALVCVLVW
jgi:hypothetical protein